MIPDELQVPGYDIEERIGKGGMASVYRARQHTFDRNVALKVLRPDLSEDESFCQRFVQESLIVAKLHHSHIVQVYDVGEFQNNFYIAMEYLHGGDLNTRLAEGIAIKDTITIIKQTAAALDFAHQKGIVHRDIKPDNIMFREDGAAVLTDFGIAKELASDMNLTQTGLIVGTPKYMAPEQIRGDSATTRADIYALGILLFQCLTDRVPFDGKDMVATAYKHFNDPVPALPPLVSAFQPIVEKMLAKEAHNRYQRAHEIVEALEELSGEAKASRKTNLDLTREYHSPKSTMDETLVHPFNQNTDQHAEQSLDTAEMPPDYTETKTVQTASIAEVDHPNSHPLTKHTASKLILFSLCCAVVLGLLAVFVKFNFGQPTAIDGETQTQASGLQNESPDLHASNTHSSLPQPDHQLDEGKRSTVQRLLSEAQNDIAAQRLKKPDANNAFNKLQRVLAIDPDNPLALAALEQISEEYAKLADRSIDRRQYRAAEMFIGDARSASSSLALIDTIQAKLDRAQTSDNQAMASIKSMERSLMIDGLLRSAAIDEDEGRLRPPSDDNALDKYLRVLELDAENKIAMSKVEELKP